MTMLAEVVDAVIGIDTHRDSERRSGTLCLVHARGSAPWMSQPRR
jgi:hypothetical protein